VTIPEPPTVNDGTLTIKQGTTTLGTFTANQSTGTTVTIPEPPTIPNFDFVSDVQHDASSHKFQMKKGHCANGAITYDQTWTDIFTAIPHSDTVVSGS